MNGGKKQRSVRKAIFQSTQTEKFVSINDLTNDASLLLEEVCARQSDPRFFALEKKCRVIMQRILLEQGWCLVSNFAFSFHNSALFSECGVSSS